MKSRMERGTGTVVAIFEKEIVYKPECTYLDLYQKRVI